MRLLLLSLYFHPDPAANSVILTDLARRLVSAGHRVTVVCAMPHYDTNAIWPAYRGRLVQHECWEGIDIWRMWLYVPQLKTNLLGRLLNYVSFNLLSTAVGLFVARPDVILAPSPPLTIGLTAWFLGLVRRAPYVYNVQDIYPDVAVRLGALRNCRVIALFSGMERYVYRHAAAITVISEGFRRNLLGKGVPREKIAVIPNFVDTEFVTPLPKDNPFARREGLLDKFLVLFAGNVGLSQGLEHVLEAAHQLQKDHAEILFLIVGSGVAKSTLERQATELGLGNVRFIPFRPRQQVPAIYASADLCLIPLRKGIALESVPSKALTIMAAGKPIIATVEAESDIGSFIQEADCGLIISPEDPQALAKAIMTLYHDPARGVRLGANGRAYVVAHCSPEIVARQYDELLRRVAQHFRRTSRALSP
jgi:colanic acid biosynthesis glycosyl transferase WcaI